MAFTINVNGTTHSLDVDGDTPLLWVLRDVLGMTGTKFGCGMALCGACTVHIDGTATRSCITPIDSIGSSQVTTIEAIGATPVGAKIQKAWLEHEVPQCGYCQSGQIMSASALLGGQAAPDRSGHRRRHERQHLPVRDLYAYTRGDQARRAISCKGGLSMITDRIASRSDTNLSRRNFLVGSAALGGGLVLSLSLPFGGSEAAAGDGFVPNAFIRVGSDGQVVLTMPYVEMGQGTYTSIPMLIAEELEVGLAQVKLEHAPPNEKLYANPLLGVQATGNSNAIRGGWKRLREAGATARIMLVAAAAKRWGVEATGLPCGEWRGDSWTDRSDARIWRACRRGGRDADSRKRHAEIAERIQADRYAGQAARHRGQGQRDVQSMASTRARRV